MMKVMAPSTRSRAVKGTTIQDLRPSARNMVSYSGFLAVLVTSASVSWEATEARRGGVGVGRGSADRAGVSQERGPTLGVLRELPGGLRQGKEGQPFLVDAAALRHHRGEGQREQRGDAHEGLQQEKRLVEILSD